MSRTGLTVRLLAAALLSLIPSMTTAQPLGVFRWQLQPYCNVLTLSVTQIGGLYTLDGTDDQCNPSGPHAAVSGVAFLNPSGSIGFGLTIVGTPGGNPVHVDATISLAGLSGTWRDSAGDTGNFTYRTGPSSGGSPRPATGLGAAAVNPGQVQLRVTGSCPAGQSMSGVNQNGTVNCIPLSTSGGDITDVFAGAGLLGGATAGAATLSVDFGGSGVATSVARSDHSHSLDSNLRVGHLALANLTTGTDNSAVGTGALFSLTEGTNNTALGFQSANSVTTGSRNVALGRRALHRDQAGTANTAVGHEALFAHDGGNGNTAVGDSALISLPTGGFNTALGYGALAQVTTGHDNIGLGMNAGNTLVNGSNNIYLGNPGLATESATIRIGAGGTHLKLFLAATRGVTTGVNNGIPILIDSSGQIGTTNSSRTTKEDIADLGEISRRIQRLRPVQFRYRKAFDDGTRPVQYGLIAEEVEEVLPELVSYGAQGQPETVAYHILPTLLVAEVQRLERARAVDRALIEQQARELAEVKALLSSLNRQLAEPR